MAGYGFNEYFGVVKDALGEEMATRLSVVVSSPQGDLKIMNLLLASILKELRKQSQAVLTPELFHLPIDAVVAAVEPAPMKSTETLASELKEADKKVMREKVTPPIPVARPIPKGLQSAMRKNDGNI